MLRPLRRLTLLAAAVSIAGCSDLPIAPAPDDAALRLSIHLMSAPVETLVAEVTAADLEHPLVFNIPIVGGLASGTIRVPAGDDRILTVRAFNAAGLETHRAERTLQVLAGENPPAELVLLPLHGDQPIEGVIGSVVVEIDPPTAEVEAGGSVTLTARVLDGEGEELDRAVQWVTLDPTVVRVDQNGVVTGVAPGEGRIAAIHADVGALAHLTVVP